MIIFERGLKVRFYDNYSTLYTENMRSIIQIAF